MMRRQPRLSRSLKGGANQEFWANQEFFFDIEAGALEKVKNKIEKGANVNGVNKYGDPAILVASQYGHLNVVKLLIEKGADVNAIDRNSGHTALMAASRKGRLDVINLLIEKGANLNTVEFSGRTALMCASMYGQLDAVKLLIVKGADSNITAEWDKKTALSYASTPEIRKYLHDLSIKKQAQNLSYVTTLGKRFGLNPNVESTIGSFLSGKKGDIEGQMNKLKQNTGISLAPKHGGSRKLNMKRRKTRRNLH